jgi:hypothetical protein
MHDILTTRQSLEGHGKYFSVNRGTQTSMNLRSVSIASGLLVVLWLAAGRGKQHVQQQYDFVLKGWHAAGWNG